MTPSFEPKSITTDTGDIVVHVARSDEPRFPPVVAVHGFGVSGVRTFRYIVPELNAAGVDVFVPEMPGLGISSPHAPAASIHFYASLVVRVVREFTDGASILLGHSMGGKVVLGAAVLYPGLVQGVALANTGGFSIYAPWLPRIGSLRAVSRALLIPKLSDAVIARSPLQEFVNGGRGRQQLLDLRHSHYEFDLEHAAIWGRLRELRAPTLLIWGIDDPILPRSTPQRFLNAVPRASVQFLKDAGHAPMKDQPEAFVRTLLNFLELDIIGRAA